MNNVEFYKIKLEELIHFLNTQLSTMNLASSTLIEFSKDTFDSEEFMMSLELIQSSIRKINQCISDVESKL